MRVITDIEVNTAYSGPQKINKVDIFLELDEHKNVGWKVQGFYGLYQYLIGYHRERRDAVKQYSEILCRLLLAEEKEAETRK